MANQIRLKRSAVSGKAPTTADLALGEIAINTADGRIYIKRSVAGVESIEQVGSVRTVAGKSGDVTLAITDVASLQSSLDGKASASHAHAIPDITNLQSSLNSKLDAFPAGTRILFHQNTAPTGWTKDTNPSLNHALRLTGGTAGWGGSQAYTTIFANRYFEGWTSGNAINGWNGYTTLSWNEMPWHQHLIFNGVDAGSATALTGSNYAARSGSYGSNGSYTIAGRDNGPDRGLTNANGSSWGHVHGWGNDAHSHVTGAWFNMDVQYADVIICSKN